MNRKTIKEFKNLINTNSGRPVFVTSDMLKVGKLFDIKKAGYQVSKICEQHIDFLLSATNDGNLWMPTFNYDFTNTKLFDIKKTPSQLGPLNEYFRLEKSNWRTNVPIFSVSGTGNIPCENKTHKINAFGHESIFSKLFKEGGYLLYYGANLSSTTFIHYIEFYSENLIYRYDKKFYGTLLYDENKYDIELTFHVRPKGYHLEYDWDKIYKDLNASYLIKKTNTQELEYIFAIKTKDLMDFLLKKIKSDPFYLLDAKSKDWVIAMHKKLGRKFLIDDFEGNI